MGMSTALAPPPVEIEVPRRKRFTRGEIERMDELGLFEGQRYELIDGYLIDKMGQNPPHASAIGLVMGWLIELFGGACIRCQMPIEVAGKDQQRSLPLPDIALPIQTHSAYRGRHPGGDELRLVVEVSDTTSRFDRKEKAALYARAAIPEYWVLDISARALIVHRHPHNGEYGQVRRLSETEQASTLARPDAVIQVSDLLP